MASSRKRLGELLVESGAIDPMQLQSALGHQRQWGGRIGQVLVDLGFVREATIVEVLAKQMGLPVVRLSEEPPDERALKLLPSNLASQHQVFPVRLEGSDRSEVLQVAMTDPTDLSLIDQVQFQTRKRIQPLLTSARDIESAISRHYFNDESVPPPDYDTSPVARIGQDDDSYLLTGESDTVPGLVSFGTGDTIPQPNENGQDAGHGSTAIDSVEEEKVGFAASGGTLAHPNVALTEPIAPTVPMTMPPGTRPPAPGADQQQRLDHDNSSEPVEELDPFAEIEPDYPNPLQGTDPAEPYDHEGASLDAWSDPLAASSVDAWGEPPIVDGESPFAESADASWPGVDPLDEPVDAMAEGGLVPAEEGQAGAAGGEGFHEAGDWDVPVVEADLTPVSESDDEWSTPSESPPEPSRENEVGRDWAEQFASADVDESAWETPVESEFAVDSEWDGETEGGQEDAWDASGQAHDFAAFDSSEQSGAAESYETAESFGSEDGYGSVDPYGAVESEESSGWPDVSDTAEPSDGSDTSGFHDAAGASDFSGYSDSEDPSEAVADNGYELGESVEGEVGVEQAYPEAAEEASEYSDGFDYSEFPGSSELTTDEGATKTFGSSQGFEAFDGSHDDGASDGFDVSEVTEAHAVSDVSEVSDAVDASEEVADETASGLADGFDGSDLPREQEHSQPGGFEIAASDGTEDATGFTGGEEDSWGAPESSDDGIWEIHDGSDVEEVDPVDVAEEVDDGAGALGADSFAFDPDSAFDSEPAFDPGDDAETEVGSGFADATDPADSAEPVDLGDVSEDGDVSTAFDEVDGFPSVEESFATSAVDVDSGAPAGDEDDPWALEPEVAGFDDGDSVVSSEIGEAAGGADTDSADAGFELHDEGVDWLAPPDDDFGGVSDASAGAADPFASSQGQAQPTEMDDWGQVSFDKTQRIVSSTKLGSGDFGEFGGFADPAEFAGDAAAWATTPADASTPVDDGTAGPSEVTEPQPEPEAASAGDDVWDAFSPAGQAAPESWAEETTEETGHELTFGVDEGSEGAFDFIEPTDKEGDGETSEQTEGSTLADSIVAIEPLASDDPSDVSDPSFQSFESFEDGGSSVGSSDSIESAGAMDRDLPVEAIEGAEAGEDVESAVDVEADGWPELVDTTSVDAVDLDDGNPAGQEGGPADASPFAGAAYDWALGSNYRAGEGEAEGGEAAPATSVGDGFVGVGDGSDDLGVFESGTADDDSEGSSVGDSLSGDAESVEESEEREGDAVAGGSMATKASDEVGSGPADESADTPEPSRVMDASVAWALLGIQQPTVKDAARVVGALADLLIRRGVINPADLKAALAQESSDPAEGEDGVETPREEETETA